MQKWKDTFHVVQLPEMMWLLFEAVIQCVFVTVLLQIRILLSVNVVRGVISLHLETQEEKAVLRLTSAQWKYWGSVWKEIDHICINSCIVFHFGLYFNSLVYLSYPLRSLNTIFLKKKKVW